MKKVVIIGGGVSGLTAGIYAQKQGYRTVICEKHFCVGGNLTGWNKGEYHIDNCIHWLTGTNKSSENYKKWKELGVIKNDNDIINHESFYTVTNGIKNLSAYRDLDRTKNEMISISSGDKKEIERFIGAVKSMRNFLGFSGENFDKKPTEREKLEFYKYASFYANKNLGDVANKFSHPLIRRFFTDFLPPFFCSLGLITCYADFSANNGGVIKGGSKECAERIKEKYLSLGGEILTSNEVIGVNIENKIAKSVELINGTKIDFDYLVLATDMETAFYKLLKVPMNYSLRKSYMNKRLKRWSCFQTAIAVDTNKIPFTNEIILPIKSKFKKEYNKNTLAVREFTYQKSFAEEGKTVLTTMTFLDEVQCEEWIELKREKEKYKQKKLQLAKVIVDIIEDAFPSLVGKLKIIDVFTPSTYNRYFGERRGSFMSFALPKNYIPYSSKNTVKSVKNVILASQWLSPVGGLPVAMNSGYKAVETLTKIDGKSSQKSKILNLKSIKKQAN